MRALWDLQAAGNRQTTIRNRVRMIDINKIHTFYFLGIGGIGMSALARYFASQGKCVMGYDKTPSPLTRELEAEGIAIQYDDDIHAIASLSPDDTLVVRTPAVPSDEEIYQYFRAHPFSIQKRAEVLGAVTRTKRALCVAGTHGKTTTSTILAHILHASHVGTGAFLGGISENYHSNLLIDNRSDFVVVEADEYDRSFHHLAPYMSVITGVDPDHLDIYGTPLAYMDSFVHYASLVRECIVVKKKVLNAIPALGKSAKHVFTYAVDDSEADFYADHIRVADGQIRFDFHTPSNTLADMQLGVPVWVNIENSVAAMALAHLAGASDEELRKGLASYAGVYRRFNVHVNTPQVAYVDDYAHHPTELQASIESVRCLYPTRHLIGVFQPHLYTRTRDFADDFARVLSTLDEVILLPIYPAREEPIAGVSSELLYSKLTCAKALVSKEQLVSCLVARTRECTAQGQACAVLTVGAGDIDRLVPQITQALKA